MVTRLSVHGGRCLPKDIHFGSVKRPVANRNCQHGYRIALLGRGTAIREQKRLGGVPTHQHGGDVGSPLFWSQPRATGEAKAAAAASTGALVAVTSRLEVRARGAAENKRTAALHSVWRPKRQCVGSKGLACLNTAHPRKAWVQGQAGRCPSSSCIYSTACRSFGAAWRRAMGYGLSRARISASGISDRCACLLLTNGQCELCFRVAFPGKPRCRVHSRAKGWRTQAQSKHLEPPGPSVSQRQKSVELRKPGSTTS